MCQFKTSHAIKHILVCLIFIVLMRYSNFNKRYSQNAQEDQKKKKKENLRIIYKHTSTVPPELGVNWKSTPVLSRVPAPCTHISRLHL